MKKKLKIRSVQLIFSMLMLVSAAGMTGCGNDRQEFLEKELVENEDTPTQEPTEAAEVTSTPEQEPTEVPQSIFVDICGAVAAPGVYELSADSRVFQAIEKAGGYLPEAAANYLNRARSLSDGQQIYVPTQEEVDSQAVFATQDGNAGNTAGDSQTEGGQLAGANAAAADGTGSSADTRINLNTADVSQLTTLTGVGESKALAIIAYREENGPFTSAEDIMNVPGIKEGTYEKIKDKIAIE